jgi:hypothetical protein
MNKLIALWMGERDGDKPWNLNYDSPDHFARLMKRLFEQEKMYHQFEIFLFRKYPTEHGYAIADCQTGWVSNNFIPWLFSDRTRFVTLFAEFLRLGATVEEFGREECPTCWKPGDYTGSLPAFCSICNGTGKVLSAWAKYVREGKDAT